MDKLVLTIGVYSIDGSSSDQIKEKKMCTSGNSVNNVSGRHTGTFNHGRVPIVRAVTIPV